MLTIKGIFGREMFETWYAMSVLIGAGLDISPVITHRFPYTDFEEAFDVGRQRHSAARSSSTGSGRRWAGRTDSLRAELDGRARRDARDRASTSPSGR